MTNAVEVLNALRECRASLKLSSLELRDGTSGGIETRLLLLLTQSLSWILVGSLLVQFEAARFVSQVVEKSSEKEMYV